MSDKDQRAALVAMVKIICFVLAPALAVLATLRVGMTALGLDRLSWSQWPDAFFGPMGENFAAPIFFLAVVGLLGPSGTTTTIWRTLRDVPRVYAAALRRPGANLLKSVLGATVVFVGPIVTVWLAPEAWTSWWTWMSVGLLASLPTLWGMTFPPGPDQWRAIAALSVGVTLTATSLCYLHREAAVAGILWPYPMMSVVSTCLLGVLAMYLVTPQGRTPFKTEG